MSRENSNNLIRNRTLSARVENLFDEINLQDQLLIPDHADDDFYDGYKQETVHTNFDKGPGPLSPPQTYLNRCRTLSSVPMADRRWQSAVDKAIRSIVSLQVTEVRSVDTNRAGIYNASGFVVDKVQGLVLTNRHVCSVGPVRIKGTFANYEEIQLRCVYVDPIHDFGLLKFDTASAVKYMDIDEIALDPDGAQVGVEVRVIGNDAGEKLSIQQGFIARIDREAPQYGVGSYSDFNTFYIQAATGTSCGSSGSPVINSKGNAVGLNAGAAKQSNHSFYLPLGGVQRALDAIRSGAACLQRGDILVEFEFATFNRLRHLGMSGVEEEALRAEVKNLAGMLVCKFVLPDGPADGKLKPGDILASVNGIKIFNFIQLEEALYCHVGQSASIEVSRNGERICYTIGVVDLSELCVPSKFLQLGDSILHNVTYTMARTLNIPLKGVFVANVGSTIVQSGYNKAAEKTILYHANQHTLSNVDDFISVIQKISDVSTLSLKGFCVPYTEQKSIFKIQADNEALMCIVFARGKDHQWYQERKLSLAINDSTQQQMVEFQRPVYAQRSNGKLAYSDCIRCLVRVQSRMPLLVDGCLQNSFSGIGFIASWEHALIVCDAVSVPSYLCKVLVTFTDSQQVIAYPVFIHPYMNFVILRFDMAEQSTWQSIRQKNPVKKFLGNSDHAETTYNFHPPALSDKFKLLLAHFDGQLTVEDVAVKCVAEQFGRSGQDVPGTGGGSGNCEFYYLSQSISEYFGALLVDDIGRIHGIVSDHNSIDDLSFCLPTFFISDAIRCVAQMLVNQRIMGRLPITAQTAQQPCLRMLPAKCQPLPISEVIDLYQQWKDCLLSACKERHTVLQVVRTCKSSQSPFECGDIILAIDQKFVARASDLHLIEQQWSIPGYDCRQMAVARVLRNYAEIEVKFQPAQLYVDQNEEDCDYLSWCGCNIQLPSMKIIEDTYCSVVNRYPISVLSGMPYISSVMVGSPAHAAQLTGGFYITALNGRRFDQIQAQHGEGDKWCDAFISCTSSQDDNQNAESMEIRLEVISRAGHQKVVTIQPDHVFWPATTFTLRRDNKGKTVITTHE
ncbi:hypothetical protein MP228_009301 [Amoeboaphelidium protococcarum]|nr:hypothetical protein MP228_009301 [Amoeboaphelidium protococcarum]